MISTGRLMETATDGRAVFDRRGDPVDLAVPAASGDAVLVVSPVTDAVKRVEEGVVASLDREDLWVVEAIALRVSVLGRLQSRFSTVEDLIEAVRDLGYVWEVSPACGP